MQDLHQAWGQLVHLIEEEEGTATNSEVPLDPTLEIFLQERGRSLRGTGNIIPAPDFLPRQELILFPGLLVKSALRGAETCSSSNSKSAGEQGLKPGPGTCLFRAPSLTPTVFYKRKKAPPCSMNFLSIADS